MRFDEAVADYQRLFDLNYHDSRWMEKVAEVRARQGKVKETIAGLQIALIDNRPEKPSNYFEVARRLESWGMLGEARDFAQKGVESAGRDLLAVPENRSGAELYTRIMTHLRQQDAAYQRLWQAVADGNSTAATFDSTLKQVEKGGIGSVTDRQWRDREVRLRQASAKAGMIVSLSAMAQTAGKYFTPEEKGTFATWLEAKGQAASSGDLIDYFLPMAAPAGLPEIEAKWDDRLMLAHARESGAMFKTHLVTLQTSRGRFAELGGQLERYANTLSIRDGKYSVLLEAADAYRKGAEYDHELAVLTAVDQRLSGENQQRFFSLLLQKRPQELVNISGNSADTWGFAALQYVMRHGDEKLTQQAIAARGHHQPPVWTSAYSALAGLYDGDRSPSINTAFQSALGDATIGERVSRPVDRTLQIAGTTWFYYGSRYGEWQGAFGNRDPEEFLAAILEQSPASSSGYVTTAQYYADAGKFDRALTDYAHVLELAPSRPDIYDRRAVLLWRQKKPAEATAEWKQALEVLGSQVNQRSIPSTFWENLRYTLNHIGNRHLLGELRPQVNTVLRDYVRHNGTYESDQILREAFVAGGDPQAGVTWMLELAAIAPEQGQFLQQLIHAKWIPAGYKDVIYQKYLAQLQAQIQKSDALARTYAESDLRTWQLTYARFLLDQGQTDRAAELVDSAVKVATEGNQGAQEQSTNENVQAPLLELQMRIAIDRKQFDTLIEQYRSHPDSAPNLEVLREVALAFQRNGQRPAARKLFEYVYAQEIAEHRLSAANILGLAEIRLQDGDTRGALQLLRRLALVVGVPFENLEPAASLLSKTGHHAEAVEFLSQLVKATPWDERIRLKLAQEQLAAGVDADSAKNEAVKVASDPQSTYTDREDAASLLRGRAVGSLGSEELNALASGDVRPENSDKPHFYSVRLRAAEGAAQVEVKERLLRNALNDNPAREPARVQLFTLLANSGKSQLAVSTIQPMLNTGFLTISRDERNELVMSNDEEETTPESPETDTGTPVQLVSEMERVKVAEKAKIAYALANSFEALQEYQKALDYFRTARTLELSKSTKATIDKNIANVRATLRRNATNDQRVPMVHVDLEQENTVRPRLMASAKTPPKSPPGATKAPKGGAQ